MTDATLNTRDLLTTEDTDQRLLFDDGTLWLRVDKTLGQESLVTDVGHRIILIHSGDLVKTPTGVWMLGGKQIGKDTTFKSRLTFLLSAMSVTDLTTVSRRKNEELEQADTVKLRVHIGRASVHSNSPQPWVQEGKEIKDAEGRTLFVAIGHKPTVEEVIETQKAPSVLEENLPTMSKLFKRAGEIQIGGKKKT